MQIVADEDAVVTAAELPGIAGFEIDRSYLAPVAGKAQQRLGIAVHGGDRETQIEQQTGMAPLARGQVEHAAAGSDQRKKAPNPVGGRVLIVR